MDGYVIWCLLLGALAVYNAVQYQRRPAVCTDCHEPNEAKQLNGVLAVAFAICAFVVAAVGAA